MALIEWNEDTFAVGVELIDNQHEMLVHLINKLADAVESHREDHVLESIFAQLQDYTKYHFDTEETYFFRLNNSDTTLHIKQHNAFIEQLKQFSKNNHDLTLISTELLSFLSNWLSNHIQIEDKKFVEKHL